MPLPTVIKIDPPRPEEALPEPIEIEPLLPLLVVPVDNTNEPLTPAVPALDVCKSNVPDVLTALNPVMNEI